MVLLSLGGLPSSNFKNEYQMTLLVIDHESGFKALHPDDSSEKETKTEPEVCCSYCYHCGWYNTGIR